MSRKRKILVTLFCIAAFVTLLRETGLFDLNLHNNSITSESLSNWNDHGFIIELPDSIYKNGVDSTHRCYNRWQDVVVELYCDDIHLGSSTDCDHVFVAVDNINYGFLSSPLYKHADFNCTVYCSSVVSLYEFKDSTIAQRQMSFSGSINIHGNFTAWGLMSTRTARMKIREHIASEVYKIVKAHVEAAQ